jgi:hypothetical protein
MLKNSWFDPSSTHNLKSGYVGREAFAIFFLQRFQIVIFFCSKNILEIVLKKIL